MSQLVAQSIAQAGNFQRWSPEDWQDYVKYGKGKEDDRERVLSRVFQRAIVEVGIFGGTEFYKRVPCLMYDPLARDSLYFPDRSFGKPCKWLPCARLIDDPFRRRTDWERLVFNLEGQTIFLREVDIRAANGEQRWAWVIDQPRVGALPMMGPRRNISSNENPVMVDSFVQLLIDFPEVYGQIAALINIDKVAKVVLSEELPRGIVNLALEYAGYPQYSGERFYQMQDQLFNLFSDDGRYTHDSLRFNLQFGLGPERRVATISTTIADYVGFDDREERI